MTTNAESTGLAVQNVPLDGTDAGTSEAILSADHPYNGTVGLAGPAMVAVFADASSNAQVRTSAGALNDVASWTPAVDIGYADYPRLAGGPSGLFLLSGTPENALTVRKFDGTTFGAAVKIADARRRRPGPSDPGRGRAAARRLRPRHRGGPRARLRHVRQRHELAVGAAAHADRRHPGHRRAARGDRSRSHRRRRLGDRRRAERRRSASWASGPEGGVSPPVPGKSVAIGLVSGKVFFKSPTGRRTQLKADTTIPVGSQIDTRHGPRAS